MMVDKQVNSDPIESGDEHRSDAGFSGRPTLSTAVRSSGARIEQEPAAGWQNILDGLLEAVALIADDGLVLMTNKAWNRATQFEENALLRIGGNFFEFMQDFVVRGDERAVRMLEAAADMRASEETHFEQHLRGVGAYEGREFRVQLTKFIYDGEVFFLVGYIDTTQVTKLKQERRSLGFRLMRAQAQERRRIARDLHDATGQQLTVLQLSLMELKRTSDSQAAARALAACEEALKLVQQEIRTLSFMNFPPSLEQYGLGNALEFLARGFGARTGLAIQVQVDDAEVVPGTISVILYRVAQEALSNIHRHAHAGKVTLKLIAHAGYLHLVIQDDGIGAHMGPNGKPAPLGVGIAGMRERLRDVGGRLTISSRPGATILKASVPRGDSSLVDMPLPGELGSHSPTVSKASC